MVFCIRRNQVVVVACDVELRKNCLCGRLGGCTGKRQSERTRGVERPNLIGKLFSERSALINFELRNLVADSPDHDRRMIAIAQHHRGDILLPPSVEIGAVVELDLVSLPHVEGFIQHQESEPIACIQECGRRRIVRRPHCVHARGLQQLHAALLCTIERSCAKRSIVVVDAAAGQFDGPAVQ